jgi:hypothetical protein
MRKNPVQSALDAGGCAENIFSTTDGIFYCCTRIIQLRLEPSIRRRWMLRGQAAPLSPNEEVTLRRIALGAVPPEELRPRAVARLETLGLVKREGATLILTPIGKSRYEALPHASPLLKPAEKAFRQELEAIATREKLRAAET